jgi:hypothetical protein
MSRILFFDNAKQSREPGFTPSTSHEFSQPFSLSIFWDSIMKSAPTPHYTFSQSLATICSR